MKKNDKVGDLIPVILAEMNWSTNTSLRLYEVCLCGDLNWGSADINQEIKPSMIEPMKPKQNFGQAEIQDGDIICFQRDLNMKE